MSWRRTQVAVALLLCFIVYKIYLSNNKDDIHKTFPGMAVKRWFGDPVVLTASHKKSYDILLLGYLKGGTTFTGEILGFRNDSFYIYEPLYKMNKFGYFKPGYDCYLTEGCRKKNHTPVLEVIRAIYRCDYTQYMDQLVTGTWQIRLSGGTKKWNIPSLQCNGTCREKYLSRCSDFGSIVSKIPRVSVNLASKLLDTLPNLKIVHLLRDPRAIMNSRMKLKWTPAKVGAKSLCNKMTNDYQAAEKVKKVYPGRLHTVFYEDMVTDPIETFRTIYKFAGYDFNAAEQFRLNSKTLCNITRSQKKNCRDSVSIARGWRHSIDKVVLSETNKACAHLYPLFGYPLLETPGEMQNTNIPLRMKTDENRNL